MITTERIMTKLERLSKEFKAAYKDKDWIKAKMIYNRVLNIVTFLEPNQKEYSTIWGNAPYIDDEEKETPGWFDRHMIMDVSFECMKLGIETRTLPMRVPQAIKKDTE